MAEEVLVERAADEGATVASATLVANTDHTLIAANASRERLIISVNVADCWLSYGSAAAVVGQGHCVRSGGAPFEEGSWKGPVHIISSGAAVVGVTEAEYAVGDDQGERAAGADTFVPSGPSDTPIPPPTAPPPGTPIT